MPRLPVLAPLARLFAFFLFSSLAFAAPPRAEIEALLSAVKSLQGATFIRNGSEHTATEAEAHLRAKWEYQDAKIHRAEDFIRLCGSRSSMSGQRYQIRFPNGSLRYCDEWLSEQLAALRHAPASHSPAPAPAH